MDQVQINIGLWQGIIGILVIVFGLGLAWGSLKSAVGHISDTLKKIEPEVKNLSEKMAVLWTELKKIEPDVKDLREKMAVLWADKIAPSGSPRKLNERGNSILNKSGIKKIVEDKKQELFDLVKLKAPKNPYDADIEIQKVMSDLPTRNPEIIDVLKNGAFQSGVDINTVLFVGSLYLRDLVFPDLGFSLDDLDKSAKVS